MTDHHTGKTELLASSPRDIGVMPPCGTGQPVGGIHRGLACSPCSMLPKHAHTHVHRATRCTVCCWVSGWNTRAERHAVPPHRHRNLCDPCTQEHCRMVRADRGVSCAIRPPSPWAWALHTRAAPGTVYHEHNPRTIAVPGELGHPHLPPKRACTSYLLYKTAAENASPSLPFPGQL